MSLSEKQENYDWFLNLGELDSKISPLFEILNRGTVQISWNYLT